MSTRATGSQEEDRAAHFLEALGWKILGRNLHFRFGEIDILAESKEAIIIVEVKAKRSASQGFAVEMITRAKKQTLIRLAKLLQPRYNKPVRVDVITIDDYASTSPQLTHYPSAIEESGI